MEIPPIDSILSTEDISKWHDDWSVERYGADSLDCSRYYKNYADSDRFVTDGTPKVGSEALLREKAERDRVLELLVRIKWITLKLRGVGIRDFLTLQEIQQLNDEREKLYEEFLAIVQSPKPTAAVQQTANDEPQRKYSAELVALFHGNAELIAELVGLSDDEIARKIKGWAKQKDKLGKSLIENPKNNLRSKYARELKKADIIHCTEKTFRARL